RERRGGGRRGRVCVPRTQARGGAGRRSGARRADVRQNQYQGQDRSRGALGRQCRSGTVLPAGRVRQRTRADDRGRKVSIEISCPCSVLRHPSQVNSAIRSSSAIAMSAASESLGAARGIAAAAGWGSAVATGVGATASSETPPNNSLSTSEGRGGDGSGGGLEKLATRGSGRSALSRSGSGASRMSAGSTSATGSS